MKITSAVHSDIHNLCHGMQAYGVHVLEEESNEESIRTTLEQKEILGMVTLTSVNESITFALHRLRPNGNYIKESFDYNPNLQKWYFRNAVAVRCSDVKAIFDYIFSPEHEKFI